MATAKKIIIACLALTGYLLLSGFSAAAQDSIRQRVILIGDAGEINGAQQKALEAAAGLVAAGKTTVFFLGDNIYPHGMALPGEKGQEVTRNILRAQYVPMRAKGAAVYFVPGNHDWDRSGPKGLARIREQGQFLQDQGDSLLQLIPANGCPDPVAIPLGDSLVVIAYDSEWWVYPFAIDNDDAGCACGNKRDVLAKLEELRYRYRHRTMLVASHHPFNSYGSHGGRFTWKDHLFPLTAANPNLYIPLPGVGSLYPFLRKTLANPEDIGHPLYKDMINKVGAVFDSMPNLVYVAGHEHGLQLIKNKRLQVVSGAGAKHTAAIRGRHSLFAASTQGFVIADLLNNGDLLLQYFIYEKEQVKEVYRYRQPYRSFSEADPLAGTPIVTDSVSVKVHPSYDKPGRLHRWLFGENYRKEWAAETTLPVLRVSEMKGGLTPLQLGGGMQSKSLRLADKNGKEWVIRSVEKSPDALLPEGLKQSFARDWLDDVTSAQHPFSALIVPPLANAVQVPHSNPVIGVVSPDTALGVYGKTFGNMVVLFEEREPAGSSDNSDKMKKNLRKDNDNTLHGKTMLRARMLDAVLGDWDRHEDQWRWRDDGKGKSKDYLPVPRDRDQVFHVTQGVFPKLASRSYILPTLRDFDPGMRQVKWLLYKTRFVNAYPSMQFSRDEWRKQAERVKASLTDSVLEAGLSRLPGSAYQIRHDQLLATLKARRDALPEAMDRYYRFTQKIADIQATDKNERVLISGTKAGGLRVQMHKVNKDGEVKDELMDKTFDPQLTKEIRIYLHNGKDSVIVADSGSSIKLRLIGGKDAKTYVVQQSPRRIRVYDTDNGSVVSDPLHRLKRRLSNDSLHTAFTPVNLYNIWMPVISLGLNLDDGFILGGGFRHIRQEGFRKYPYASLQQFSVAHSFSTSAYRIRYTGEWIQAIGKADVVVQAQIRAPNNTVNFFGRGNETAFNKKDNHIRYYRTRFSTYLFEPSLRWRGGKGSHLNIGPSLYYYRFDPDDNRGRFIEQVAAIGSYDSLTIARAKLHVGAAVEYVSDKRNNKVIPQWGTYIRTRIHAYKGTGDYAADFGQLIQEVALYKSLNARASIILADRFGGVIGFGKAAFYQSAFVGGHENLLGYRQYRFAGQHSFYNNLELRVKIADVGSYILPGQIGITGFWDTGRVWESDDNSGKWHHGTGAGIYFAPASMVAFNMVMGHSREGWYPYFTMGFRF